MLYQLQAHLSRVCIAQLEHVVWWENWSNTFPANVYLSKANNRNTRKGCEICFKLTIKTCLYCWFWTCFTPSSSISIVEFEQVNVSWVIVPVNGVPKPLIIWLTHDQNQRFIIYQFNGQKHVQSYKQKH